MVLTKQKSTIHSHMHKVSTWLIHGIDKSRHPHNIHTRTGCLHCYQHSSTWLQWSHYREHSQHSHMYKLSACLIHGVQKNKHSRRIAHMFKLPACLYMVVKDQTLTEHSHMYKLPILVSAFRGLAAMHVLLYQLPQHLHMYKPSTWLIHDAEKQTSTQNSTHVQ